MTDRVHCVSVIFCIYRVFTIFHKDFEKCIYIYIHGDHSRHHIVHVIRYPTHDKTAERENSRKNRTR